MKVKATRAHQNRYGDDFEKDVGATYSLPDSEGERLVRRGLVEKIADEDGTEDKRALGDGDGAGAATEGNGEERPASGRKEGAGADAGKSSKSGSG